MMRKILWLCAVLIGSLQPLVAQQVGLVKDIDSSASLHIPHPMFEIGRLGNILFFSMDDKDHGRELWRSDGTSSGTHMIKDINPGVKGSNTGLFTLFNNELYFYATDQSHGTELWKTDGTEAGTKLVRDIVKGPGSFGFGSIAATSTQVYVFGYSQGNYSNAELWISDGTESGMTQVTIPKISHAVSAVGTTNTVFFTATSDADEQVWVTDGTTQGTFQIPDLSPRSSGRSNVPYFRMGSKVYFAAHNNSGDGLYSSDGTVAGTIKIEQLRPFHLTVDDNNLYYISISGGATIMKSNGTVNGAVPFSSELTSAQFLFVHKSTCYFSGLGANGYELWKSDGTPAGTVLIKDIKPGTAGSYPSNFSAYNDVIYFQANASDKGAEIWKTDGTAQGTILLKNVLKESSSTPEFIVPNPVNELLFFAADAVNGGQCWTSNGTTAGTSILKLIDKGNSSSEPTEFTILNNKLFFTAANAQFGRELYVSDGTSGGTNMIKDLSAGNSSGVFVNLITNASTVMFKGFDGSHFNLYSSDGTSEGTVVVKSNFMASYLGSLNRNAYLMGYNETFTQFGLWKSDGTAAGTVLIKYFGDRLQNNSVQLLGQSTPNTFYFLGSENTNGNELWKSDGTADGTNLIKNINPDVASSNPLNFIALGDRMVFTANDGTSGREPWISDGTAAGTFNLADTNPGAQDCTCDNFTVLGNAVYFSIYSPSGYQLWRSDGTQDGTSMVKQLSEGPDYIPSGSLVSYNGKLLFSADHSDHGVELWQADDNGIQFFNDLNVGTQGSYPSSFTVVKDTLFFRAFDESGERKTWISDGTADHTQPLELTPGLSFNDEPHLPIVYLNGLYLASSDNGIFGQELYSLSFHPIEQPRITGIVEGDDKGINLFPNPSTGKINISGISSESVDLSIQDYSGRSLKQISLNSSEGIISFDVSYLASGIYFAKIKSGNEISIRKFIIL